MRRGKRARGEDGERTPSRNPPNFSSPQTSASIPEARGRRARGGDALPPREGFGEEEKAQNWPPNPGGEHGVQRGRRNRAPLLQLPRKTLTSTLARRQGHTKTPFAENGRAYRTRGCPKRASRTERKARIPAPGETTCGLT